MAKAPKAPKEETHPPPAEHAQGPGRRRTVAGPLSLYPLSFEEAVDALLEVKMSPEELRSRKP
jgi:hypothetical protein